MKFKPYEAVLSRLAADLRPRIVNAAIRRISQVIEEQINAKLTTALIEKKIVEKVTPEVVEQQIHEKMTPQLIEREIAEKLTAEAVEQQLRGRLTPEAIEQMVREKLDPEIIEQQIRERLTAKLVDEIFMSKMLPHSLSRANVYLPNTIVSRPAQEEYMLASNALARDFFHPEFRAFYEDRLKLGQMTTIHRKVWEFAYVFHHLNRLGALKPGARGLGFGVGSERLPAIFASMGVDVTATDAPHDVGGWRETGQYSASLEDLFHPDIISRETFDRLVHYQGADMNNIPDELTGYDFCWSSCALEHLGSLQNGMDFIVNSVEKTLRVGGVAVHTTELNLSSNEETLETEGCVLYRKQDLERLCQRLEERGHWVQPLRLEPGDLPPDYLVDLPPYSSNPHLKLMLASYVTTSVGIVAKRGR
jgi:hypothetical protein